MSNYGELYLPPERPRYNPQNGQFLKGHKTHNKGREWSEWMSKRGQQRAARGWANIEAARHNPRPDNAERWSKAVIAVDDDGRFYPFPSFQEAQRRTGYSHKAIVRCAQQNLSRRKNLRTGEVNTDHRFKGLRWYYETDEIWTSKIKQQ